MGVKVTDESLPELSGCEIDPEETRDENPVTSVESESEVPRKTGSDR